MKHSQKSLEKAIMNAISAHYEDRDELPEEYEIGINPDTLDVLVIDEGDGVGGWWDLPDGYNYECLVDLEPETIEACAAAYFD